MLSYNKQVAELFGETEVQYPEFLGMRYKSEYAPIVSISDACYFKLNDCRDVLQLNAQCIDNDSIL